MVEHGLNAVPFQHPQIDEWRENFVGMQFVDERTNLKITGAVDDIWQMRDAISLNESSSSPRYVILSGLSCISSSPAEIPHYVAARERRANKTIAIHLADVSDLIAIYGIPHGTEWRYSTSVNDRFR
jgi:hypothetical protein